MTAIVVPWPLTARRDLVRRQARRFLDLSLKGAENNLAAQLETQRSALLKKQVSADEVDRQVRALEGAIRAEIWRLTFEPRVG